MNEVHLSDCDVATLEFDELCFDYGIELDEDVSFTFTLHAMSAFCELG